MPPTASLPPCIVLGLETQIGLCVVRELGAAGVPVIGVAQEPDAIGLASRYLWRSMLVAAPRSDELIDALNRLGDEHGECYLLAVSEVNTEWLLAQRGRLRGVRPILPDAAALAIVLDKQRTLAIAREVGIRTPMSIEPRSLDELDALARTFPFPAVLKWKDPGKVAPLLAARSLELIKAEHVASAAELQSVGRRYAPLGVWPLVQEYCAGQGLGQFFFMHEGRAVRRFQHRRVAEWPPEGGFSSVCDSVPLSAHAALQDRSIRLLQAIGWKGVAMVEYRDDPATGESRLMEINGRFWGSYPLAWHCGAGFALLAYALQGRGRMPTLPPLREGVRCRMVVTEVKRLLRLLFQPRRVADPSYRIEPMREIARFVLDFFRPGVRYFVWSADDPAPFRADARNMLRKALRRP